MRAVWTGALGVVIALTGCAYDAAPEPMAIAPGGRGPGGQFGVLGGVGEGEKSKGSMDADDAAPSPQEEAEMDKRSREDREASRLRAARPAKKPGVAAPEPAGSDEGRVREWFPEAFLWQPLVETNDDGLASVDVRVPDQLTTWRVLALAHSAQGRQAGTTHHFDTRLPISVDPITPGWLYVGDEVVIPSQVVSMGQGFSGSVRTGARGSLSGFGGAELSVSAGGSRVIGTAVTAERSGQGLFTAELKDSGFVDAAERKVRVRPGGRPVQTLRGGVLSGPRSFTLDRPGAIEQSVQVQVFPGPLSVLHSELERVGNSPPGAYGYALIDGVQVLSATAGVEVDAGALRTLRIRSWQRLVRQARAPDALLAAQLVAGLRNPQDSLAQTTRDRLVRTIEVSQRGDGTWASASRSTLQQVLVQTAMTARVLPESSRGARVRASGALERNLPSVDDPFTAAWLLASGVIDASLRPALEDLVVESMNIGPDGTRELLIPSGVLDPTSARPTRAQALAVTWLALAEREDLPWRGDLVSELLQGWSAERGFGAGWADTLALDAVRGGLASLDKPVAVILEVDGVEVARSSVDPAQPKIPAILQAAVGGEVGVRSEPAVPGLAFVAAHTAYVPFTGLEALPGVEVEVQAGPMVSGRRSMLTLTIAAPSGASVEVVQGLPAGTAAEVPGSTQALLSAPARVDQDRVTLVTRRFGAGEVLELELVVTPSFAGQMSTRPLEIRAGGQQVQVAPMQWVVRPGGGA